MLNANNGQQNTHLGGKKIKRATPPQADTPQKLNRKELLKSLEKIPPLIDLEREETS